MKEIGMDKDAFTADIMRLLAQVDEHLPKSKDGEWKGIRSALEEILVLVDRTYAET